MAEEYNGWTNRETWLVGVWDFFDADTIKEALQNTTENPERIGYEVIANDEALGGMKRALTLYLADWMEQEHDEFIEEATATLDPYIKDFIADQKINWLEIAGHYDEEIKEALSAQKEGATWRQ
jgi:predicted RNase H-like HicB family nuclease